MFRIVGDEVGAVAKENDRPVVEVPNVRGSAVVWRVSFGREVIVLVASDRHDMVKVEKNQMCVISAQEERKKEEERCLAGLN